MALLHRVAVPVLALPSPFPPSREALPMRGAPLSTQPLSRMSPSSKPACAVTRGPALRSSLRRGKPTPPPAFAAAMARLSHCPLNALLQALPVRAAKKK